MSEDCLHNIRVGCWVAHRPIDRRMSGPYDSHQNKGAAMSKANVQIDTASTEVKTLFCDHQEVVIIYVDPVAASNESAVSVFIKMLDKDKGGQLASLLGTILKNLEDTHGQKHSRVSGETTIDP